VLAALEAGRSLWRRWRIGSSRFPRNVIILRGGQRERKRREAMARLAAVPEQHERVIVATGRYLGKGFDDQRLGIPSSFMPIAWRGTLAQYAGRLHRLHDAKRDVVIYDYVDRGVPVFLAPMAAKRAAGYSAIGYAVADDSGLFNRGLEANIV
jgi:superfamily II DNA or RNA helicase